MSGPGKVPGGSISRTLSWSRWVARLMCRKSKTGAHRSLCRNYRKRKGTSDCWPAPRRIGLLTAPRSGRGPRRGAFQAPALVGDPARIGKSCASHAPKHVSAHPWIPLSACETLPGTPRCRSPPSRNVFRASAMCRRRRGVVWWRHARNLDTGQIRSWRR